MGRLWLKVTGAGISAEQHVTVFMMMIFIYSTDLFEILINSETKQVTDIFF